MEHRNYSSGIVRNICLTAFGTLVNRRATQCDQASKYHVKVSIKSYKSHPTTYGGCVSKRDWLIFKQIKGIKKFDDNNTRFFLTIAIFQANSLKFPLTLRALCYITVLTAIQLPDWPQHQTELLPVLE
ncbi:MAG: hypothetical protein NZO16_05690 [Deltaproteobacteria bacterium]|nr:hypothetical protein [Deltaproteobacteria bacterium]